MATITTNPATAFGFSFRSPDGDAPINTIANVADMLRFLRYGLDGEHIDLQGDGASGFHWLLDGLEATLRAAVEVLERDHDAYAAGRDQGSRDGRVIWERRGMEAAMRAAGATEAHIGRMLDAKAIAEPLDLLADYAEAYLLGWRAGALAERDRHFRSGCRVGLINMGMPEARIAAVIAELTGEETGEETGDAPPAA